jgi:GntR family transcriptional regulator, transcriptional repressor for pyruvate dehydrogenase complex
VQIRVKIRSAAIDTVQHLPSQVATFISREIASGQLRAGDRLPAENDMAKRFGVSRNVIREAISQLRADGLVQAKQGIGAFVLGPERRTAIRIDPDELKASAGMEQLFELRRILETEAASLAAQRCDADDLAKIKAALDRMRGEERWEDGSIEADLSFHREIAQATDNDFIYTFICFICERIRKSIHYARQTNPLQRLVDINVSEHVKIFEALEAHDPALAGRAMRVHITSAAERVGIKLGDASETGK